MNKGDDYYIWGLETIWDEYSFSMYKQAKEIDASKMSLPKLTAKDLRKICKDIKFNNSHIPLLIYPDSDQDFLYGSYLMQTYKYKLFVDIMGEDVQGEFINGLTYINGVHSIKYWYKCCNDSIKKSMISVDLKKAKINFETDLSDEEIDLTKYKKINPDVYTRDELLVAYELTRSINRSFILELSTICMSPLTSNYTASDLKLFIIEIYNYLIGKNLVDKS